MAITTLDGVISGMQPPRFLTKGVSATLVAGRPHTWWPLAGVPGAGGYDATLNGAILTGNSVSGQIARTNPVSGNAYLARLSGLVGQTGTLILADRLWQNRLASTTGAQSITSPTWPARDNAGTTNGDGVLLGLEFSTANTAGAPTVLPFTYTNQAGTGSRTANIIDAVTATTAIGSFLRYDLQAGDTGVRSVQSFNINTTALTSAVINAVAYRVLATLELTANIPAAIDALTSGFPRIFDGTVPFLIFIPTATTATTFSGSYVESQG